MMFCAYAILKKVSYAVWVCHFLVPTMPFWLRCGDRVMIVLVPYIILNGVFPAIVS